MSDAIEAALASIRHSADIITEHNFADQRLYLLRDIDRLCAAIPTHEAAKGGGGAWYALHSKTGAHVGLWTDKSIPERLLADYPGGTITTLYSAPTSPASGERDAIPTMQEAHATALAAAEEFYDRASSEETLWTGCGDQEVPFSATMRRVKAKQAFDAIRDAALRMEGK